MHHIFLEENLINLENKKAIILSNSENYNHLANVLRVKKGEEVLVSIENANANNTFDYLCEIDNISNEKIELIIKEKINKKELPITLTLIQGLPKQEKLEFIVDACSELGVSNIIPCEMKNSIVKFDDKKKIQKIERLKKIAKSACEQSKRGKIVNINDIASLDKAIDIVKNYEHKILFYEEASPNNTLKNYVEKIKANEKVVYIIGPEGGFTKEEVENLKNNGFVVLSLGSRILRTEIAAITSASYIMLHSDNLS